MGVSTALGVSVCVCVCVCIKQDNPAWGTVVMHNNPPLVPTLAFSIVLAQGSNFPLSRKNLLTSQQQCDLRVSWRFCREIQEGYCVTYCTLHSSSLYLLVHFSPACGQWGSLSLPLKLSFLGVQSLNSKMFRYFFFFLHFIPYQIFKIILGLLFEWNQNMMRVSANWNTIIYL